MEKKLGVVMHAHYPSQDGNFKIGGPGPKDQKSYVLPHMWTLDHGQTQQWDWTMST
jgi:hypothetical protein